MNNNHLDGLYPIVSRDNDFHISAIPDIARPEGIEQPVYNRYSTWVLIDNRGPQSIYRILLADEEHLYLIKVGGMDGAKPIYFSPSKRASDRIRMDRSKCDQLYYSQRFRAVHDSFIPEHMESGVCLPNREDKFKKKNEVVTYALSQWGDLLLVDKNIYADAIKSLVLQFCVSDVSVRRWLETSYFYREHPNASLDRVWEQGHCNKGSVEEPKRKIKTKIPFKKDNFNVGRPISSKRIGMPGTHNNRRLAPRIATIIRNFIYKEVKETTDTFLIIYQRVNDICLVSYNRDSNGDVKKYKIDENKLPSPKRLKEIARKYYNEALGELVKRTKKIRGRKFQKTGGSASDIVHEGLPIYDIDATIADNYLLYGDDIIEIDGCRKPTVIIAKDRLSKAIVGLYVTFRSERSEGYLACIMSACMRKETELNMWGLGELGGMVYGCPYAIFVDRGAGSSEIVTNKAAEDLRVTTIIAKPGTPQTKGGIENTMGSFQRYISHVLSGSYYPSGDIEYDKHRKRYAEDGAVPVKVFMRALWMMVSEHNLKPITSPELSLDMLKNSKFSANPQGVFNYYRERRRGDIAWDWPLETAIRKFGLEKKCHAPNGIVTNDSAKYSCPQLIEHSYAYEQQFKKTYVATIFTILNWSFVVYWDSPNGHLIELKEKKLPFSDEIIGPQWYRDYINMRKRHAIGNGYKEHAAGKKMIWEKSKNHVSKETQKNMVSVDKRSTRKQNKDMTVEERESAKQYGAEYLERQQYEALYGQLRPTKDAERNTDSIAEDAIFSLGFDNNQVLRLDD